MKADDPRARSHPVDQAALQALTASTDTPGLVHPMATTALPANLQKVPGVVSFFASNYQTPVMLANNLTAGAEMAVVRTDGSVAKAYNYIVATASDGAVYFNGPHYNFPSHHFAASTPVVVESLFGHVPRYVETVGFILRCTNRAMRSRTSIRGFLVCLFGIVLTTPAHSQLCADFTTTPGMALVSTPNEREPTLLRISDVYGSAATIGTVEVSLAGVNVDIRQSNEVSINLPVISCRHQVSTLVGGIKTDEIDLAGFEDALANIRSGCPMRADAAGVPTKVSSPAGTLCTATLC